MDSQRLFTPQEIDEFIPQLETIFEHIYTCKARAEALATQVLARKPSLEPAEIAHGQLIQSQVEFLMGAIQDDIQQILTLGGVMKDIEKGLVDFPGEVDGREVWLCWKIGEPHLRFWHGLEEGFNQRQALHRQDKNTTLH